MDVLVVIPAKGSSRRIPSKNLRLLGGKPLFLWTVKAAVEAGIGRVVVSTEDERVREMAPVEVIDRPASLAVDPAEAPDVALHALDEVGGTNVVMLLPTSPFRTAEHVREAFDLHRRMGANVLSVTEAPDLRRKLHANVRGQMTALPVAAPVLLNGAIWIATSQRLRRDGFFAGDGAVPYVMGADEGIDIDTEDDWARAQRILDRRRSASTSTA